MKKRNLIMGLMIFLIAATSNLSNAQLKGETFASAKASKSADITYTFAKTPGFIYETATNQYAGICVDIMKKFEQFVKTKYGITVKVNYKLVPGDTFSGMLSAVKSANGGVFGLGNITITEARQKAYNFSPPFINNISLLMTQKTIPSLSKMEDMSSVFAGMTAYTTKGSTNEIELLKWKKAYFPTMKVSYVGSFSDAVNKVTSDPKAFTNVDFTYYLDALKDKKPVKRHMAGMSASEEFGILMPKSNDWSPILAEFMNSGFLESSEYKAVIRKHLGESAIKLLESVK